MLLKIETTPFSVPFLVPMLKIHTGSSIIQWQTFGVVGVVDGGTGSNSDGGGREAGGEADMDESQQRRPGLLSIGSGGEIQPQTYRDRDTHTDSLTPPSEIIL